MGQVVQLRTRRERMNRAKWSAVREDGVVCVTLEWRTADGKVWSMNQGIPLWEFKQLTHPDFHFWAMIQFMQDVARNRGARF